MREPCPPTREIEPAEPESLRQGVRRRYSDEQILAELRGCAARIGRSPTMREFAIDPQTRAHPQTVIERFGTWNRAKRLAGLVPRRFATRDELLTQLRRLGNELGRTPTGPDLEARRGTVPSKSLLWHTFGSLSEALREAGFDLPVGEQRLERAVAQGALLSRRLGRLPRFTDWASARRGDAGMLTEWQVYRLFDAKRGGWSRFQQLVRERLAAQGAEVDEEGWIGPQAVAAAIAASRARQDARSSGARTAGSALPST